MQATATRRPGSATLACRPRPAGADRHAFTLIELLVVISVIATLAAMLLPAIGSVRAMAKQTVCANNQRQMMQAIIAYAGDNDGITPPADGRPAPAGSGDIAGNPVLMLMYSDLLPAEIIVPGSMFAVGTTTWGDASYRWPSVISCPSVNPGSPNTRWYFTTRWFTGYPAGVASERFGAGGSMLLSSMLPAMPFLAETCKLDNPLQAGYWWNKDPATLGANFNVPAIRLTHRQRANVSYKDGHVAARSRSQLIAEDQVWDRFWTPP